MEIALKDVVLPDNIEELKAQAAADLSKNFQASSSDRISTKDKQFTLPDGSNRGSSLEVLILAVAYSNSYYEGQYDAMNPKPPSCFAIGKSETGMVPDSSVENPKSTECDLCEQNQFGSSGRGKACKNTVKLLCIVPEYDKMVSLHIPPTGMKDFKASLNKFIGPNSEGGYSYITDCIVTFTFKSSVSFSVPVIDSVVPNKEADKAFALSIEAKKQLFK